MTKQTSNEGDRAERSGVLLGAIIAAFLIQGVAATAGWEEVLVSALLGATLLLALWTAEARKHIMRVAGLVAGALVLISAAEVLTGHVDGGATHLANALLVGLAPTAVVIGVLRSLQRKQAVTVQAVLGVLSVYILLGMFFAFIYGAVNHLGGAPFFAADQQPTSPHFLYFSFSTLTTVGYGDFTARSNLGHTLAVSEALMGQIYLVTVVSLIVGNLGRSRPTASPAPTSRAQG